MARCTGKGPQRCGWGDHFYDTVDAEAEISKLTDRWADLGDEINYREGYPFLTEEPELRDKLMAWGRESFEPDIK